jgi:hypothetical protein
VIDAVGYPHVEQAKTTSQDQRWNLTRPLDPPAYDISISQRSEWIGLNGFPPLGKDFGLLGRRCTRGDVKMQEISSLHLIELR